MTATQHQLVPLVPRIEVANVGANASPGIVHNPTGIAAALNGAPAQWRPDLAAGLRPASVPSPFALAELTHFVLERACPNGGDPRPSLAGPPDSTGARLLECSELLFEGLVAGRLQFTWLLSRDLGQSGRLPALLGSNKIGLIRDHTMVVWGYMLASGVPVLSGERLERADTTSALRAVVRPGASASAAVGPLLNAMKTECQATWDAAKPWMSLFDRVLALHPERSLEAASVALDRDVRSVGPFALPTGANGAVEQRYLLSHAPQFIPRLQSALSTASVEVVADRLNLSVQGSVVGAVSIATEGDDAGHGLALHLKDDAHKIPGAAAPALIHERWAHRTELHGHINPIRSRIPSLTRALQATPMLLSDVARAVVPVLEGAPIRTGPRLAEFLARTGETLPSVAYRDHMVANGRAVVLPLDGDVQLLLCEDEPVVSGAGRGGLGELSMLGTSLWLCFVLQEHDHAIGYSNLLGEPLFAEYEGCPIYADIDTVERFWARGPASQSGIEPRLWHTPARAKKMVATLQRFAAAYAEPEQDRFGKLLHVAAARFLGRLFNDDDVMSGINTPGVGSQTKRHGPGFSVGELGPLKPFVDVVRSQPT